MKRLLVLRHAKAGPHDEKHDKQRALIGRGRDDAARMGRAMHEKSYIPDLVLCSSARRTVETWENAAPALGAHPRTDFLDALYDAPEERILNLVRAAARNVSALLLIGHNPGLERFARMMVRKPADAEGRRRVLALAEKFPTSALAVIEFEAEDWAAIDGATGTLSDYLTPTSLKSE